MRSGWGVGWVLGLLAGYLTPPLLGLGGASLVVAGKSWSLLWASIVLLVGAFFQADDRFTQLITVLAATGIGWVAFQGTPSLQAGLAVAIVWLMLLGAVRQLIDLGTGGGSSDPAQLAAATWIPGVLWIALFWSVTVACLWAGARRLLGI